MSKVLSPSKKYVTDSKRAEEITNSLIEMIAKDVSPFSILNDTGFVNFVNVLNHTYELPNENTLTSKHLPELYKTKCKEIKEKLSKVEAVHFTIDSWTDINHDLYFLAVTAHFCTDGTLQRNTLQVSHFSTQDEVERVRKTVACTVNDWKISSKIKTVVSNCEDLDVPILNENDWNIISGITSVLEPLYLATEEMSSDHYVTISQIIPIVYCIEAKLKNLENLQSDVELFRKNFLYQLEKYHKEIENNLVYTLATFLDPRYKGNVFRSKDSVKLIKDHLSKTYGNTRNENESVENEETNIIHWTSNPIKWWNTKGNKMIPELVKPALEYLCIPALAAPSEHLFSNMGQIILERRIQLQPKYVNMLTVLGCN
ncbi:E3 SUMO-protein ligase ZBED1 [Colletes latitarsis]|uniref:E3 SUMO-protein ligase ZBED1 n=1 Tax=Colletes latitarsis TaxID=2605962 RepID=UPI004035FC87